MWEFVSFFGVAQNEIENLTCFLKRKCDFDKIIIGNDAFYLLAFDLTLTNLFSNTKYSSKILKTGQIIDFVLHKHVKKAVSFSNLQKYML